MNKSAEKLHALIDMVNSAFKFSKEDGFGWYALTYKEGGFYIQELSVIYHPTRDAIVKIYIHTPESEWDKFSHFKAIESLTESFMRQILFSNIVPDDMLERGCVKTFANFKKEILIDKNKK